MVRSIFKRFLQAVVFASLHLGPTYAQADMGAFNAEIEQIANHVEAGKISRSEGSREMLAASKAFFPDDRLMHAYFESQVGYLERLERGELTQQQAQELFDLRTQRYVAAVRAREARAYEERSAAEQLQRDQEARMRAEAEYQMRLAQEAELERQRVERNANILRSIGNAFTNSFGR